MLVLKLEYKYYGKAWEFGNFKELKDFLKNWVVWKLMPKSKCKQRRTEFL